MTLSGGGRVKIYDACKVHFVLGVANIEVSAVPCGFLHQVAGLTGSLSY